MIARPPALSLAPDTIVDALDLNRYAEIASRSDLLANLWASACLAAQRGDFAALIYHCHQIQIVNKQAFALVKALGSREPDQ